MFFYTFFLKILLAALTIAMFSIAFFLFNNNSDEYATEKFERDLLNADPSLAQKYAAIQDNRAREALRITMDYYRGNTLHAVAEFARDQQRFPNGMPLAKLTELAIQIADSGGDFKTFLKNQSTNFQLLNQTGSPELLQQYLNTIAAIKQLGSESRQLLIDDPMAVPVFWALKAHPNLWYFYQQHNDCLSALLGATLIYDEELDASEVSRSIITYLKAAQAAPEVVTALFNAVNEQGGDDTLNADLPDIYSLVLPILVQNSEALQLAQRQKLPIWEFFCIMAINPDATTNYPDNQEYGLYLATLQQVKPNLWRQAQEQPGVLELDRRLPAYSEKIMSDFGNTNIAAFLLSEYGKSDMLLRQAGKVLTTYGDLGYAILLDYRETPEFKYFLAKPEVGFRLIPMLGHFQQEAFTKLADNVAWVDRYFDSEGKLRDIETSFLELCPFVGGIATVADNWSQGYPCEWNEIGFAALDVADCALLLASAGSSAGLTAAKTAAVTGGKTAIKKTVKELAANGILTRTTKGIKPAAVNELRQVHNFQNLIKLRQLAITSARGVVLGTKKIAHPFFTVNTHWHQLTPATWRLTCKIAGGVILLNTLMERTLPGLPQYLSNHSAQFVANLNETISTLPEHIATQISQRHRGKNQEKYIWGALISGGFFLLIFIWLVRFKSSWNRSRRV